MQVKFFGSGLVWDSARSKLLCEFKNGMLITEDEHTISFLRKFNYPEEVVISNKAPPEAISDHIELKIVEDPKQEDNPLGLKPFVPETPKAPKKGAKK